jgi:FtsP/CotA-like multicopper oxidase with cupredoxin domain
MYDRRMTFREIDPENPLGPLSEPPYPNNFARGVLGTNAITVNYGDVVRIFFSCTQPYGPGCAMPHPMHLHGHRVAVLYVGEWNETYDESKLNLNNPVYRDTVTVHTDSFVVVQLAATNPGAWRWHCHVDIHHRSGMAVLLDVGGDDAVEAVRVTSSC